MSSPLVASQPPPKFATPAPCAAKNLSVHKAILSFVVFALCAALLVGSALQIDLSLIVLPIMAVGGTFAALRVVNLIRFARRFVQAMERRTTSEDASALAFRHVVVVPIYKETAETIGQTLRTLAAHRAASRNYVVLCALEKADAAREDKWRRIREDFDGRFLDLARTVHVVAPHECPGKAANVNQAVRTYAATQDRESFVDTFVTVIDCDTRIDERYFVELEREAKALDDPHAAVFAAPTFFESNRAEVPCFVRVMDDLWSMAAAANIFSNSKLGFPISNYSLTLQMSDAMGYWDVDYDSVGEDFHTFVKASIVLTENVRLVPLGVPMNNEHVAGHSYVGALLARYSQSLRHALGISSTAYLLKHVAAAPLRPRKLLLLLLCCESHLLPLSYFAAGSYVAGCCCAGTFGTFFHGAKLYAFGALSVAAFAFFNAGLGIYKSVQHRFRRRVLRRPRPSFAELAGDVRDYFVQGACVLAYFIVPFGYRMYQNLVFRRNETYYGSVEERTRKFRRDAQRGECERR